MFLKKLYMKKELLIFVVKVAIYALGLLAAYLGVSSLTSCSAQQHVTSTGSASIITTDTTFVKHGGFIRSKNFVPYE